MDLALHLLAPQIQKAIAQAGVLARVLVGVDLQWQLIGFRLDVEIFEPQLDFSGRQIQIDGLGAAPHNLSGDGDDRLVAQPLELLEQ